VCLCVSWQVHPRLSSWCGSGSKPAVCLCVYYIRKCVCLCVSWQVHLCPSSWCGSGSKPAVCLCVCITYVSVCACVCHGRCTLVRQAGVIQVQSLPCVCVCALHTQVCVCVCAMAGAPSPVKLVWFRFKACRVCVYYIRKCVCVCVPWQAHPRPSSWCGSGSKPVVCLCVCVTYVSVCACVCHGRCTLVRQAGVVQVQACCAQM